MRKFFVLAGLATLTLLSFTIVVKTRENKNAVSAVAQIHSALQGSIDSLQNWYDIEWLPVAQKGDEKRLQLALKNGRQRYKKIEWAIEFFFPQTAKELNGPPLPEIEAEEHIVIPPSGFQVIEELVYPFEESNRGLLLQETKKWNSLLHRLQTLWQQHNFRDDQVWTALRLELMRITSLGLAGFDTPLSCTSITEISSSLEGVKEAVAVYKKEAKRAAFNQFFYHINKAKEYLDANKEFSSFNRAAFISSCLQPLTKQLFALQKSLGIATKNIYAVNLEEPGLFGSLSFNSNFFTQGQDAWINKEKVFLGKLLFSDPVLSSNDQMACVSCHQPQRAFTDGLVKGKSFAGTSLIRNTPTLLYAGLQQSQFYDMRAAFLEDQVRNVVENKDEIHGSLAEAAGKLSKQDKYVGLFNEAFSNEWDTVTEWQIQVALASYVRSLASFTSRFDGFLQGNLKLTADEEEGFNLFMGKAKCGSCHFTPLFNGTIPPMYTSTESEIIGVPLNKNLLTMDRDSGRYTIHQLAELKGAFKTPTLRNIAATAPYMHNGVFKTLEEVVDFYNEGGGSGLGYTVENQTLPEEKLNLTATEKRKIILFLKTLSDHNY